MDWGSPVARGFFVFSYSKILNNWFIHLTLCLAWYIMELNKKPNKPDMNKNNKKIRDALLVETWKRYKNMITMEDLAAIFQLKLKRTYELLKENYDK